MTDARGPSPTVVFLDGDTYDRDDVSFASFADRWDCVFHDSTGPDQLAERIAGQRIVVTNKVRLDAAVLASEAAADLELVAIAATGTNNVDLDAARARGIAVTHVTGYAAAAVAQHAFALMLELATHVGTYGREVADGAWSRSRSFALLTHPCVELAGKTLGIVGHGSIGQAVHDIARGFGMKVLVAGRRKDPDPPAGRHPFELVLVRSDFLSLHCPLTPETEGLIGERALRAMKRSAFLINTSRGGLVDEAALIRALEEGEIAGAGLDVISEEPPAADHPMVRAAGRLDNLVVTPHSAWTPVETRQRLLDDVAESVAAFLRGQLRNRVA